VRRGRCGGETGDGNLSRRIVDVLACNVITRKHALVIYRSDLVAICVDRIIVAKQNASSSFIHALRSVPFN